MKTLLKAAAVFAILIGGQAMILGALYKIQSWSPPFIFGVEVDFLLYGLFLVVGGVALDFANRRAAQEEKLDLSEEKLKEYAEQPAPIAIEEEDLLL